MKHIAKKIVVSVLNWQAKRLLERNNITLVGVAGSIGKTSTKLAIVKLLEDTYRVAYQEGNYNDQVTVPLVLFQATNPTSISNIFSWLKVFISNERQLKQPYPFDVAVLELGTDGEGQIQSFDYLDLDIGVLTAVSMEHMEFFENLDAVAKEELALVNFSKKLIFNQDLTADYLTGQHISYGLKKADYAFQRLKKNNSGFSFEVVHNNKKLFSATYNGISDSELYSLLAAVSVAHELGIKPANMKKAMEKIRPFAGRLQLLEGVHQSIIIDDSYNASPKAVEQSLAALKDIKASQRIALLGNMNELGDFSEQAHKDVGKLCSPDYLDLVITLGVDANRYLAPAAEANGCKVLTTGSPVQAGELIKTFLESGAAILVKGSQNGVFAEEAIKILLKNPKDASKLVRQSPEWMTKKAQQFEL